MKPRAETHWSLNKVVSCYFERSLHISSSGGHVQFESLHLCGDLCALRRLARHKPNWTTRLRVHWPHAPFITEELLSFPFCYSATNHWLKDSSLLCHAVNHNQGKVTKTSCRANGPPHSLPEAAETLKSCVWVGVHDPPSWLLAVTGSPGVSHECIFTHIVLMTYLHSLQ